MKNIGNFLGILLVISILGCRKSPELAVGYIPYFNGDVKTNITITQLTLKASFTRLNADKIAECGFELCEKEGVKPVVYPIAKPGSSEMDLTIDTAFQESANFKARAWIIVGKKKFYSAYTYFAGLGFPAPELTSVSREYVIKDELFYINGRYFSNDYSTSMIVKVDNVRANIVSATFNKLGVEMPGIKKKGKVMISVNVLGKDATGMLEIENYWPEIYSVTPEAISPNDEISIKGKFRSSYSKNIFPVQYDFSKYDIVKYTDDEIIIRPGAYMNCDSAYSIYFTLSSTYSYDYINSGYKVTRKGNWRGLKKAPFKLDADYAYYGLSCNGKGYVIQFNMLNLPTVFWRYDPQSDSWTKLPQFPGIYRINPVFTECNGLIYCGLGFDYYSFKRADFYKFDPAANTWSACAGFNFNYIDGFSVFSRTIQNLIYVFSDQQKQKAIYNPATNKWEVSACDVPYSSSAKKTFENNGNYYHQTDWQFYQFDPSGNSFTLQYSNYDISYFASAFTAGDRIFMYGSCRMWEVDLTNKRADLHNELSNYYSKDAYGSIKLFDINDESYFLTQPSIFSKFNLAK